MLALEGRQLGNYDVIRRIKVGGMGAVYEGRQRTAFGRRVAIKVILGNYAADREMRRRFAREARVVARLHHPHILPLIEFGDEQGILYLVMPFIEGGTLTSYLRHSLPDLNEVSAIFLQLLDAVEYAHDEGLIHRDIKSSNVLLELRRSGPPHAYLGDFGLVRTLRAEVEPTRTQLPLEQVPGTPHYMAPEQTFGIVTPATDIYALGVLLFQLLVGELPYDDPDEVEVIQMQLHADIPSPCEHDASIPAGLGEVVQIAMAKMAEDRFKDIAEFREAFLSALNGSTQVGSGPLIDEEEPVEELDPSDPAILAPPAPPTPHLRPLTAPLSPAEARPRPRPYTRQLEAEELTEVALPPRPQPPVTNLPRPAQAPFRAQRDTLSIPPGAHPYRGRRIRRGQASPKRHRRWPLLLMVAVLVPILLLSLILVPRMLGISLFPASLPLLGSTSLATITVTTKSKSLHDSYVLTASPHNQSADVGARVIPDHNLSALASGNRIVGTSGTRSANAARATGNLLFTNGGPEDVVVPNGMRFTSGTGVQIQVIQTVTVRARKNQQDGQAFVPAVALVDGAAGNIPPGSLSVTCCGPGVLVSDPVAFSGGVDGETAKFVTQADLDGVRKALQGGLQQQALQQLQSQLGTNEALASAPTYAVTVTADHAVGGTADQIQVKVTVIAKAAAYNRETAQQVAIQLSSLHGDQTFGNTYQLNGNPIVATPRVVQRGANGLLYLSVSVTTNWIYRLSPDQVSQWRQSIRGASPSLALAYLNAQPGVLSAQVHLPFGSDTLPNNVDDIEIVLVSGT